MSLPSPLWQIQPTCELPDDFLQTVQRYTGGLPGKAIAQLLWQRGVRDRDQIQGFLDPNHYSPTSPFAFGDEMKQAIARLQVAYEQQEQVAIWGDFDADGITATAVLWEGLGQFFPPPERLRYLIPNRLSESHGLAIAGIDTLAAAGVHLIVTCDTGSTNRRELEYAQQRGIDVIVTDHHTLPDQRPPVTAILNPRSFPSNHPLATLSGVAVAFKLVEALYATLPQVPRRPLDSLLDLVAIGLIADLVELRGDCRYLAQRGIEQLQRNQTLVPPPRPGVAKLLEFCKRSGDRPTDISFGIGPRINAISRIHGDARFGVELLTSKDPQRCQQLAEETELANARRRALQKEVAQQVAARLGETDLSTTRVIVLEDPQWSVGVLGLVAGQIAQEYGKPTILLTSGSSPAGESLALTEQAIARGSARTVNQIDLYQLVHQQFHLLTSFGGHPFAAGLSLPVENIPLFAEAINRQLRQQQTEGGRFSSGPVVRADLTVTVAELGKELFRELKLLEPCGMGNPAPRLLIQNCWFHNAWNRNIQDSRGRKLRYIKTEFELCDESGARFPGIWWEHYKDELPPDRCDVIAELDFNSFHKRYEIRLIALRPTIPQLPNPTPTVDWLLDCRPPLPTPSSLPPLALTHCPDSWTTLQIWFRQAVKEGRTLAIAYSPPGNEPAEDLWHQFVGIAKYLSRTGETVQRSRLLEKLGVSDRTLDIGCQSLEILGFQVTTHGTAVQIVWQPPQVAEVEQQRAIAHFLSAVREERFRRQYFATVPLDVMQAIAQQMLTGQSPHSTN